VAGEIGILNVGAGDTKLSFDPKKPDEVKRASAIVADMLKRGFALLIEVGKDDKGPLYRRALGFDAETAEYIIAGAPADLEVPNVKGPAAPPRSRRKAAPTRVPATRTNAIAVARTAGG
jgi:hypothetical protein